MFPIGGYCDSCAGAAKGCVDCPIHSDADEVEEDA